MKKIKQNAREKLLDVTFEEVYLNGYSATSIDAILKKAGVPKGSMYHYFKSKKSLVLAMIEERLSPKMDSFFLFKRVDGLSVYGSLEQILQNISNNSALINSGCPMYRLMVELSPVDSDFDNIIKIGYENMLNNLSAMLKDGVNAKEFSNSLNCDNFAKFIISSVWGVLSLSPTISSSKSFLEQTIFILKALDCYRN
jgi:TetR/AcrR family transcriptional repressor of nem operon